MSYLEGKAIQLLKDITAKFDLNTELTTRLLEITEAYNNRSGSEDSRAEPVMANGKTRLSDYLEEAVPESEIGDDWTKGYEECKRRLFKIVGYQLRALATSAAPTPADAGGLCDRIMALPVPHSKLVGVGPKSSYRFGYIAARQDAADLCGKGFEDPAPTGESLPVVKIGYISGHYEDGLQAEILDVSRVYDGMMLYTPAGA